MNVFETAEIRKFLLKVFKYAVEDDNTVLPYQNYHGVVSVTSSGDSRCKISWSAEYKPKGMPADEVKTLIGSLLAVLMDNMMASLKP